jgi:hypothetical protein
MENVGLVVDDLELTIAFFFALGLECEGVGPTSNVGGDASFSVRATNCQASIQPVRRVLFPLKGNPP